MRIWTAASTCLAFVSATPLLAQNEESPSESAWFKAYQSARQDHTFGCFGQEDPESCKSLVDGLAAAYAEMPANYQHGVFPDRMNAVANYGQVLLELGRVSEARTVLEAGWTEVMDHYDGGRHSHTLAENLKLLRHLGSARLAASDEAGAEEAFLLGRQITGAVLQRSRETAGERSERFLENLFNSLLEGEKMETGLAQLYTLQATRSPSPAAWSKVADTRGREVEWILAADEYQAEGFAEDDKRYRAALVYYEKGEAHLEARELGNDQALDAYASAAALFEDLITKENIEAEVEEAGKWGLHEAAELQISRYGQLGAKAYAGLAETYARLGRKSEAKRALEMANDVVAGFGSYLYLAGAGDTVLPRLGLAQALLLD